MPYIFLDTFDSVEKEHNTAFLRIAGENNAKRSYICHVDVLLCVAL